MSIGNVLFMGWTVFFISLDEAFTASEEREILSVHVHYL